MDMSSRLKPSLDYVSFSHDFDFVVDTNRVLLSFITHARISLFLSLSLYVCLTFVQEQINQEKGHFFIFISFGYIEERNDTNLTEKKPIIDCECIDFERSTLVRFVITHGLERRDALLFPPKTPLSWETPCQQRLHLLSRYLNNWRRVVRESIFVTFPHCSAIWGAKGTAWREKQVILRLDEDFRMSAFAGIEKQAARYCVS